MHVPYLVSSPQTSSQERYFLSHPCSQKGWLVEWRSRKCQTGEWLSWSQMTRLWTRLSWCTWLAVSAQAKGIPPVGVLTRFPHHVACPSTSASVPLLCPFHTLPLFFKAPQRPHFLLSLCWSSSASRGHFANLHNSVLKEGTSSYFRKRLGPCDRFTVNTTNMSLLKQKLVLCLLKLSEQLLKLEGLLAESMTQGLIPAVAEKKRKRILANINLKKGSEWLFSSHHL